MNEDAMVLLKNGKRLATTAFYRESVHWSDNNFSLSNPLFSCNIAATTILPCTQIFPESEIVTHLFSSNSIAEDEDVMEADMVVEEPAVEGVEEVEDEGFKVGTCEDVGNRNERSTCMVKPSLPPRPVEEFQTWEDIAAGATVPENAEDEGFGDEGWEEEEEQGLRMVEMKDLDLRRCLVTCLRGSIMYWINGIRILLLQIANLQ